MWGAPAQLLADKDTYLSRNFLIGWRDQLVVSFSKSIFDHDSCQEEKPASLKTYSLQQL